MQSNDGIAVLSPGQCFNLDDAPHLLYCGDEGSSDIFDDFLLAVCDWVFYSGIVFNEYLSNRSSDCLLFHVQFHFDFGLLQTLFSVVFV
jgi:hypothetical protein